MIFEEAEEEHKAEIELATPAEPLWCQTVPLVDVEIKLRNKVSLEGRLSSSGFEGHTWLLKAILLPS